MNFKIGGDIVVVRNDVKENGFEDSKIIKAKLTAIRTVLGDNKFCDNSSLDLKDSDTPVILIAKDEEGNFYSQTFNDDVESDLEYAIMSKDAFLEDVYKRRNEALLKYIKLDMMTESFQER